MCGQDDGATRLRFLPEEIAETGQGLCVQSTLRLVHEKYGRIMEERPGEREALLPAVRECAYSLVEAGCDVELVSHGLDPLSRAFDAKHAGGEAKVLACGEVVVEQRIVGENADQAPGVWSVAPWIEAADADLSDIRLRQRCQHLDQRRLAGAVRAEHG